ncbi:ATP-grasp domain-containing protein [Bacillus arachidis]|uniref:ATP-grasp domain-containing protein n=1 Tax=Bacillus arachidis TaxID=2819290 RepID=A0ABS3NZL9_9BACI|nr:ATP-grasp domain-containing protein [Bacillus arachidis]MBO1626025.1 ATP-grasp domain-containing protein [Bacillus arachidis]
MKLKVLVFPCGSQVAIDINFALRHAIRVELFGASSIADHGKYVYRNYIDNVPNIAEENFLEEFNHILQEKQIDFIIPTHDTVALFLKEHESHLAARVISADVETVRICRYKSLTYKYLAHHSFVPVIYKRVKDVTKYPVFLKPDDGQGGKGTILVTNEQELQFYLNKSPNLLICEYLPGEEISVDCFTDREGNLRVVSPRKRRRMLAGISVHTELIEVSNEIMKTAETLNQELSFRGHWFFQMKKHNDGCYKLLEISSRMAGTAVLTIGRDINLPLLSILDCAGVDIEIQPNNYCIEMDRSFINRYQIDIYYERVYIDLDDTLIVNNKVNSYLLMFLYQCLNEQKELILITKHKYNVSETLETYKLQSKLFTKVIHINDWDQKFKYMQTDRPAIFIDNSFLERKEAREKLGISSFDVSNIECLIDWKG